MKSGISVVICCYNSAGLLPRTLKFICEQKINAAVNWEIIIIDNNSSDKTSETAEQLLKEYKCPVAYKILTQRKQGLSSARKMGLDNSQYEYILFCDDDNWLDDKYIETGFQILEENIKIGALGGQSVAETEGSIPTWFFENKQNYSIGKQAKESGDITWSNGVLWGAGMFVRSTALNQLYINGFKSLLTDRKGSQLSSGGDTELCFAIRLAGWVIWYDERLILKHFLPDERLKWLYLRKLSRGFGAQKADFDPYLNIFEELPSYKQKWQYQSLKLIRKIRGYGIKKLINFNNLSEGDPEVLRIEKSLGRLEELLKIRGLYSRRIKSIRNAKWRKVFSPGEIYF